MTTTITTLYERYSPGITARCRALLRDHDRAEDATQDTFVRFMERYKHLSDSPNVSALLYRIATNRCHDELRTSHRRQDLTSLAASKQAQHRPEQSASMELKCIASRLSETERELIELRHVDGMTLSQIARRRRTSISGTRRQLLAICLKLALVVFLVLAAITLLVSESHSQLNPALPAQVVEPGEQEDSSDKANVTDEAEAFYEACEQKNQWRACARAADLLYNKRDFERSLLAAKAVCLSPDATRSYKLQGCQRAGLLAQWHTRDDELARRMFELGCEGDGADDSKLDASFRETSCAHALSLLRKE